MLLLIYNPLVPLAVRLLNHNDATAVNALSCIKDAIYYLLCAISTSLLLFTCSI